MTRRVWIVCGLGTQVRQLAACSDKNNTVLPVGPTTHHYRPGLVDVLLPEWDSIVNP